MKYKSVLTQNNLEKVLFLIIPVLFTFPFFKESISTFLFIFLSGVALLYAFKKNSFSLEGKEFFCLSIPFWIVLIRSVFDLPWQSSFSPVKNTLFFLLFPVVFSLLPNNAFTRQKVSFYLNLLKNTCALISMAYVLLFLFYYDFNDFFVYKYNIPKFRDFVYNETPFFKIHPTYFTSIVFLCCASSMEAILKRKKYYELLYVFLFTAITFLLLVKINILFLFILITGMLLFRSTLNLKQKGILLFGLIFSSILMVLYIPGVKSRFAETIESYNKPPSGLAYDSTNIRIAIVECSLELVRENYLKGIGFSELAPALENCFSKNYQTTFYANDTYLTHNYYLYILISSGVLGFAFLLLFIYKITSVIINVNNFLLSVSMTNIFLLNFTEDFFYRHYGLFFFCLIFYSFYKMGITDSENNKNSLNA